MVYPEDRLVSRKKNGKYGRIIASFAKDDLGRDILVAVRRNGKLIKCVSRSEDWEEI